MRGRLAPLGGLEHLLAINDVRVRVFRACRDLGWTLRLWRDSEALTPVLTSMRLIPDAYFQVQRLIDGTPKTAGFFLEVELANKSQKVLRSKLERYAELYYRGQYAEIFGTRAMRLLVVYVPPAEGQTDRRVQAGLDEARRMGFTRARLAGLDRLKRVRPQDCLIGPLWHEPGQSGAAPLFQISGESTYLSRE